MKKLQTLLAAAMCSVVLASASAQSTQGYGAVVRVDGVASYSLGDNNWHPLESGKNLPVGAIIRTGHNGVVDVVLGKDIFFAQTTTRPDRISTAPDPKVRGLVNNTPSVAQNVVRVTPNTVLAIDKLTITDTGADTVSDTELNLTEGKIFASVKKINGASQYLIKLPNGIAGVRGTLLSISADGTVACFESEGGGVVLSLIGSDGLPKTFLVSPGQMFSPGGSGSSPLPAEAMSTLEDVFRALRTVYAQVVNFTFDHTQCFISPTQGNNGHHKGGGNSGNGGGNGGGN